MIKRLKKVRDKQVDQLERQHDRRKQQAAQALNQQQGNSAAPSADEMQALRREIESLRQEVQRLKKE